MTSAHRIKQPLREDAILRLYGQAALDRERARVARKRAEAALRPLFFVGPTGAPIKPGLHIVRGGPWVRAF